MGDSTVDIVASVGGAAGVYGLAYMMGSGAPPLPALAVLSGVRFVVSGMISGDARSKLNKFSLGKDGAVKLVRPGFLAGSVAYLYMRNGAPQLSTEYAMALGLVYVACLGGEYLALKVYGMTLAPDSS